MSVKDVLHKIEEHKPDIVFIDGAYMLRLDNKSSSKARWETIMNTVEVLKKAAMQKNIPIVATFQFDQKSKEQSLGSIMGGQAIGQIASVAIGLSDDKEGNLANIAHVQYKLLNLIKGRNGEQGIIQLRFDMSRSIIEQSAVISGDASEFGEDGEEDFATDSDNGGMPTNPPETVSSTDWTEEVSDDL